MRVEMTSRSIDVVASKEGTLTFGVSSVAVVLILLIGGWKTAAAITAGVVVFAWSLSWMQHHWDAARARASRMTAGVRHVRPRTH